MSTGLIIFAFVFLLIAIRFPIGLAMFFAGSAGYLYLMDWNFLVWFNLLKTIPYARLSNYDLVVIPMFLLMGQFAIYGGLSQSLFSGVSAFIGNRRGGLALASIGACAGFGAISGSSVATAATMSQVALPELRKHGYSGRLATGALAAGGTLGILIPPSVPLIVYGILTQESIGRLFVASVIPALIAVLGYFIVINILVRKNPEEGPAGPVSSWPERLKKLIEITPVLLVFIVIIVGIYGGWATPTEAAAIGAGACALITLVKRRLSVAVLTRCLVGTAQASAMIFLILLGADFLNSSLALSRMPAEVADWVLGLNASPFLVLAFILLIYLILGCVMDSLAMLLLTIPIFYPIIMGLDLFGLSASDKSVWFGVLSLMVVEIGLITPPIGMNVFIVNKMARDVSLVETYKGVFPFLISDALRIILLAFVPSITLYLLK